MDRKCVLLRVGIDSGCGGIQGPLFKDGTFDFVCIPDNKRVSVHTYGNMVGRDGRLHADYFAEARRAVAAKHTVHVDPRGNLTYGDPTPPEEVAADVAAQRLALSTAASEMGCGRRLGPDHRPALIWQDTSRSPWRGWRATLNRRF